MNTWYLLAIIWFALDAGFFLGCVFAGEIAVRWRRQW